MQPPMQDYLSISKQKPSFPEYLNFQVLRDIGIDRLQTLSSDLWTDYNLHDPGVTILEVLCYAITDLGYRNNFDIQDLLALNPQDSDSQENNFFTPDELLTCNPVTDLDLRKRIIDIPGVRNVQFEKVGVPNDATGEVAIPYEPAIAIDLPNQQLCYVPIESSPDTSSEKSETSEPLSENTIKPRNTTEGTSLEDIKSTAPRLHPRGLYTVCLDLDSQYRTNSCGHLTRDWSSTIDEVKRVLCSTRSLCEDTYDIELLGEEEIGLCADIQLESGADAEDVLVEMYVRLQAFLSPRLRFYTLQELLQKGKSPADIFAGRPMTLEHSDRPYWRDNRAYDSHGFIDTDELAALTPPKLIHTSDLYQVILDVPGVAAVQKLSIANYINGLRQSQGHPWTLPLTEGYRPVLGIQQSIVQVYLGDLPAPVNTDEVIRRYYEQQAAYIKAVRDPYELNLSVPQGRHYDLADYYSIHHEFPLTYGISEDGLPDSVPALRKVQAQQLKGYLVFFDQILANYLSQLSHVRDLFSWELDADSDGTANGDTAGEPSGTRPVSKQKTYFSQAINFPGVETIIQGIDGDSVTGEHASYLSAIAEDSATYRDRRSRFLDHLLARFAESFTDYVLLNYRLFEADQAFSRKRFEQDIIRDKGQFLQNYPLLSHDRFRAFNYCDCDDVWNTENISGFQRRVARLLGFQDGRRRDLNHYRVEPVSGVVLSVRCSASTPSLVTSTVYPSEVEALAEQESLLRVLLHACFYARLTYESFYHYGWEVRCFVAEDVIAFRYERYFPSRAERQQALEPLLAYLAGYYERLIESMSAAPTAPSEQDPEAVTTRPQPTLPFTTDPVELPESLITAVEDVDGTWRIQLIIPNESEAASGESENTESEPADTAIMLTEPIRFVSNQVYGSEADAIATGLALLDDLFTAIRQRERYCGIVLLNEDGTEDDETPKAIPYFGYALKNTDGTIVAETSLIDHQGQTLSDVRDRFFSEAERDLALKAWFCHLEANQNHFEFRVVPDADGWRFEFVSLASELLFTGVATYPTPDAAWDAAAIAASSLRRRRRYLNTTAEPDAPSVSITDGDGTLLMTADTDQDLATLFQQLNDLEAFLRYEAVEISDPPSVRYRYQLVDRPLGDDLEVTLLQSIETYPDQTTARDCFYQDVLAVLFEPGVVCPNQTRDGFGFRLLSQPGILLSEVAENAQPYATEEARDEAIEKIFLLVRTARYVITVQPFAQFLTVYEPEQTEEQASSPSMPEYMGQMRPNDGPSLLQGRWGYVEEEAAWNHGNDLMELIQELQNFRTIEGDGIYGWELTNPEKDHVWARRYHACEQERTQFIQELQNWVNDEGFYLLEHILLRPRSQQVVLAQVDASEEAPPPSQPSEPDMASHDQELDKLLPIIVNPDDAQYPPTDPDRLARQDPYSFWVTVVLPYWPRRFRDVDFRRFVELTLRLEAPAHVALKIAWVNVHQFHQLQTAYRPWLVQLAQYTCQGVACDLTRALNQLLDILPRLRNVYPKATLHNCEQNHPGDSPILLNRTAIGDAND